MDEVPRTRRLPRPPAFACARATPQKSASSCSTRALERQADRLGQVDRAIGHAALPGDRLFRRAVLLRPAMVDGPHAVRRQGCEVDRGPGPRRPAHLHRPRARPCGDDDLRAVWQPRGREMRRSTSSPISSFPMSGTTTRDNKPGKQHEPQIHRRRPHHPPHHRTGNHLPAGAGNAAGPDAGSCWRRTGRGCRRPARSTTTTC